MYLQHLVFGLIITILSVNNCFAFDDNISISCEKMLEQFNIGYKSFEFQQKYNEYLVDNGYVTKTMEPFTQIFGVFEKLPKNLSEDFFGINSLLRGTQVIFDNYMGNYNNTERPTNENIKEFLNKVSECIPNNIKCTKTVNVADMVCDSSELYRSFDGTCNNLDNPRNGAAFTAFSRLVEAFYDDNVLDIRKNWQGYQLNSPRKIVNEVWTETKSEFHIYIYFSSLKLKQIPNMGWYIFAQFLTHDIASSLTSPHSGNETTPIRCCSADYKTFISKSKMAHTCSPFEIPKNDKYHKNTKLFCHNFIRHQATFPNDCKLGPAEQLNQVTHFIDLSIIYSGNNETAHNLRTHNYGMLKINEDNILAKVENCNGPKCYYTGDWRVVQTQSLTLMHSLFVRLHNRIAITLREINLQWNDEKLFQESRRINIAIYQNIVFNKFVPILIGERLQLSKYYNKTVDPSTTNDFITGVFRSLHTLTPSHVEFYNTDFKITDSISISKMIFETKDYLKSNFDDITRGLLFQKINTGNLKDEMINKIFNGIDLISVDIQRGRDHGIAPYWRYREFCGYPKIKQFSDLYPLISIKNIQKLRQVYLSPLDIDIYVGGQLEEKGNNIMGPTFNCLTKIQFARYETGDRFFYLHENNPYPFTKTQLEQINKFTFAKLICLVTNATHVPEFSFFIPSAGLNNIIECSSLKEFNLKDWKL